MLEIIVEGAESLEAYSQVPIRFLVDRRFTVSWGRQGLSGIVLTEEPVAHPYWYDYDEFEPPSAWARWDLRNWTFLAAYDGGHRVGGAVVASPTRDLYMLEGRPDLACLWDIRVLPEMRGQGVGRSLFDAAARSARAAGAKLLKIETQNINVSACEFYARQGCSLEGVHPRVYGRDLDQMQLLWYAHLDQRS